MNSKRQAYARLVNEPLAVSRPGTLQQVLRILPFSLFHLVVLPDLFFVRANSNLQENFVWNNVVFRSTMY